jgi:NADH:ubiquinone reductase (H+-translocating)
LSTLTQPLFPGHRPRVVIVGGGFGGLNAAKSLAHLPVDVTLIDRRNHHTFQPLLYQVALAVLSPADIAQPIRTIFRGQPNVEVLMDEVTGIDTAGHAVETGSGARIAYNYLALATGSTHSYFGNEAWAPLAPGLKTVEDAVEMRRRVLLAFELAERHMQEHGWHPPLNFVVIGGGPTGVELAGAICDIARIYMREDFRHINPAEARVLLLDGGEHVLAAYPLDLRIKAEKALAELGVEVHTRTHVTGIAPTWVEAAANGQTVRFESTVTLWAAGVQASPLGKLLGAPLDKRGCVIVDSQLNPPAMPEIFILGDLAHVEQDGRQVPGVAQPAMQMGDHVGRAVAADLARKPRPSFRYFDKGDMATIGRMAAVADVKWPFRAHMNGLPAWVTWLVIHVFFLIGFRSRARVFAAWVWTYFTFTFGARLITGDLHLPGWDELAAKGPEKTSTEQEESALHR